MGIAPFSVSLCLCFQGLTLVCGVAAAGVFMLPSILRLAIGLSLSYPAFFFLFLTTF